VNSVMQDEIHSVTKLISTMVSRLFSRLDCRDVYAWSVSEESELLLIESSVHSPINRLLRSGNSHRAVDTAKSRGIFTLQRSYGGMFNSTRVVLHV
jgi:hypothetical protein